MRLLVSVLVATCVIWSAVMFPGSAKAVAQGASGCAGSWLIRITISGRDVVEDGLVTFETDGDLALVGPPIVPPLPNADGAPLFVSGGVGHWRETGDAGCAFDLVRLLGDADGNGLGTVYWRGSAEPEPTGTGISASFTYTQSTPLGQTVASGSGMLLGTSLGPAVAAGGSAEATVDLTTFENQEFGFRLTYDPVRWQVQSESNSALYLTDGNSIVALAGSRALPTDATACVDESIASLSVTSTRQDYEPLLDASGNLMRRDGPLAAYAISSYRDRSGEERFERVECRVLPEGRGVITILQGGALAEVEAATADLELLLSQFQIE